MRTLRFNISRLVCEECGIGVKWDFYKPGWVHSPTQSEKSEMVNMSHNITIEEVFDVVERGCE
jgi:hypothetical protein